MPRYFNVKLTSGTAYGPFTIYHTSVSTSNILIRVSNMLPATNIVRSELTTTEGVEVIIPDGVSTIILYSVSCGTQYSQSLPTPSVTPSTSITPSISRTPIPSITPSATPNASISSTPSPTPTVTPSATRTSGYAYCLGYNISDCSYACLEYSSSCLPVPSPTPTISVSPSITITPSKTISVSPSISAGGFYVYCLGYSSTDCNVACTNYFIDCLGTSPTPSVSITPSVSRNPALSNTPTPSVSISPSVTPTRTPSISITPSTTRPQAAPTTYKAVARIKLEDTVQVYIPRSEYGTAEDVISRGIVVFYYVKPPSSYSNYQGPKKWMPLHYFKNSYLTATSNQDYFYNAYNPVYSSSPVISPTNGTTLANNNLGSECDLTSCEYVASVNGIIAGSSIFFILTAWNNYTNFYGLDINGNFRRTLGGYLPIRFCQNYYTRCPSNNSCWFSAKLDYQQVNVNYDFNTSFNAPTFKNSVGNSQWSWVSNVSSVLNIPVTY